MIFYIHERYYSDRDTRITPNNQVKDKALDQLQKEPLSHTNHQQTPTQHWKTLKVPNIIEDTTKYLNYNNRNNLIYRLHYLGLVNTNTQDILMNYNTSNDGWDAFLNISAYQPGHFSEKLSAITEGENLMSLKISYQLSGGPDTFINK